MQLQEHTPENHFYVHSLGPEAIQIVETRYSHSLILSPDQGVASWPVNNIAELETHHLQPILDWRPDVVLLATGRRQRFPESAAGGRWQEAPRRGASRGSAEGDAFPARRYC